MRPLTLTGGNPSPDWLFRAIQDIMQASQEADPQAVVSDPKTPNSVKIGRGLLYEDPADFSLKFKGKNGTITTLAPP